MYKNAKLYSGTCTVFLANLDVLLKKLVFRLNQSTLTPHVQPRQVVTNIFSNSCNALIN